MWRDLVGVCKRCSSWTINNDCPFCQARYIEELEAANKFLQEEVKECREVIGMSEEELIGESWVAVPPKWRRAEQDLNKEQREEKEKWLEGLWEDLIGGTEDDES